jgi:hypothetical protein
MRTGTLTLRNETLLRGPYFRKETPLTLLTPASNVKLFIVMTATNCMLLTSQQASWCEPADELNECHHQET